MARTTCAVASRKRRKRIRKEAKGYWGDRKNHLRHTTDAVNKAQAQSYKDRKKKKGDFRKLWIMRISVAAKINGLSYSKLMHGLKKSASELNRKILAKLAVDEPTAFAQLASRAKKALAH